MIVHDIVDSVPPQEVSHAGLASGGQLLRGGGAVLSPPAQILIVCL